MSDDSHAPFPTLTSQAVSRLMKRAATCAGTEMILDYDEQRASLVTALVCDGVILRWYLEGPVDRERYAEEVARLEIHKRQSLGMGLRH